MGSTLLADKAAVDRAVAAAEAAAPGLAGMGARARSNLLHSAAALIRERAQEMARLLTREQGKPVADNLKEIFFGCEVLRYYAEEAVRENAVSPIRAAAL